MLRCSTGNAAEPLALRPAQRRQRGFSGPAGTLAAPPADPAGSL